MEDCNYLLTIRLPIKALDDAAAREEARRQLVDMYVMRSDYDTGEMFIDKDYAVKLQRISAGKSPEGVQI